MEKHRLLEIEKYVVNYFQEQQQSRILAKDLIADDDGFVKSLTKADVEYLFS